MNKFMHYNEDGTIRTEAIDKFETMLDQLPSEEDTKKINDSVRQPQEASNHSEDTAWLNHLCRNLWTRETSEVIDSAVELERSMRQPLTPAREAEFRKLLSEFKGVDGHLITPEHQEELMSMIRALATTEVVPS